MKKYLCINLEENYPNFKTKFYIIQRNFLIEEKFNFIPSYIEFLNKKLYNIKNFFEWIIYKFKPIDINKKYLKRLKRKYIDYLNINTINFFNKNFIVENNIDNKTTIVFYSQCNDEFLDYFLYNNLSIIINEFNNIIILNFKKFKKFLLKEKKSQFFIFDKTFNLKDNIINQKNEYYINYINYV